MNFSTGIFQDILKWCIWKSAFEIIVHQTYNQLHNNLRLFDVLANFPFTTSKTMHDYNL